jgi:hypothetical protein
MIGEIERLLMELSAAGVRYLVVGGVAVVLHGYIRSTLDLDLVIDLDADNVDRARRVFRECGTSDVAIDIVAKEPFPFDEAYQRALRARVGDSIVTVASIDDVIAMKRGTGRTQDAVDIEILTELKKPLPPPDEIRDEPFDGSFEGTRRRQALSGRALEPAERLRWFERHMAELRSLLGRAS